MFTRPQVFLFPVNDESTLFAVYTLTSDEPIGGVGVSGNGWWKYQTLGMESTSVIGFPNASDAVDAMLSEESL